MTTNTSNLLLFQSLHEPFAKWLKQRNALLDTLFYDVSIISDEELQLLYPLSAEEGSILVVPPSGAGVLSVWHSVQAFLEQGGGREIHTLAVAGVGSSALGSAALARNVADAIQAPVAAVVSGYGLADVATEAVGGAAIFGALNSARYMLGEFDRVLSKNETYKKLSESLSLASQNSKDTLTVKALLESPELNIKLLVGHSKGNLVLSEALYAIKKTSPDRLKHLADSLQIVTLSARIAMPMEFSPEQVIDVMGTLDFLGEINSRQTIKVDYPVHGAGHHTNTQYPFSLPVTSTLKSMREQGLM